jgi:AraC-like DNA-binding protein
MTAMIRAQSLRGYRNLVSDLGGNPTRLLRKAGIDPATLDQLTTFIRFEDMINLLECSATALDCPDFGLRLADRQDLGILGTLAVAIRHSATVGDAGRCASKYLYVHSPAVAFTITPGGKKSEVLLAFDILLEHPPHWAQTAEHAVGLAWRILRLLSEDRSHLREVRLPHRPLGPGPTYRSRFPAPVVFQAERAALVIAAGDLNLPLSEPRDELHDLATRHLEQQLPNRHNVLQDQVRQAIEALLGTGTCSYREVAKALYMHPRTFQRRMREQGTTFEAVKDEVRRDLAQRYLSQPDVPLTQVTALLDYNEQSALSRSCRRWFDTTPSAVRTGLSSRSPVPATG